VNRPLAIGLAAATLAGCGRARPVAKPADTRVRPQPGADLAALPVEPPRAARSAPPAVAARPLDLGDDRPATAVAVPSPPAGGSIAFVFADQRQAWVTRTPESLQLPAMAYGDGKVFVSGGFETYSFYALDAREGHFLWRAHDLPDNGPTAPIYEDDRVIFNTESCTLVALDARSGKRLWSRYLGDPTLAQPSAAGGLVFASHPTPPGNGGGYGYALSAFRARDGAPVWTTAIDGELLAAPVVDGDSVYASTVAGTTYRMLRAGGRALWSRPLHATTAPWIADGAIYLSRRERGGGEAEVVVSTASGRLVRAHAAVTAPYLADLPEDVADWKKLWAFEGSRPVVAGGVRYVARGGLVEAADPESGAARWIRRDRAARGARSLGTVALAGPEVVIATRRGQLYGLDVDTGYTLWAYDIGHPVLAEPIVARGWIYVATQDGLVVALEVADATLDGWHMFGGNPRHNGPT
jgi:Ca-activated chloride channel family protein